MTEPTKYERLPIDPYAPATNCFGIDGDAYGIAIAQGLKDWATGTGEPVLPTPEGVNCPEYWIARAASRQVAISMLEAAKKANVTIEQYHALVNIADELAFD